MYIASPPAAERVRVAQYASGHKLSAPQQVLAFDHSDAAVGGSGKQFAYQGDLRSDPNFAIDRLQVIAHGLRARGQEGGFHAVALLARADLGAAGPRPIRPTAGVRIV
jgi:hypothetical protein